MMRLSKARPLNQSKTITRKDGVEITQEPIVNTIEEDPDAYRVTGIESYDEVEQTATKNPIFYDQLINKSQSRTSRVRWTHSRSHSTIAGIWI